MEDLLARDLRHVWHPCTQMKDCEAFPPVEIAGAEGAYLVLRDGRRLLDATSSWWCKSLGHGHPRLRAALVRQAERFEHVISAQTVNPALVDLSEALAGLCPPLDKVFYAGDGSMAVEIAAKMALQAQRLRGRPERTRFIALENGYHGESGLALGLSDLGLYREPYAAVLPEPFVLRGMPYASDPEDPLWTDATAAWPALEKQLEPWADSSAALILEPLLQGAGGMRVYGPDLLRRLREWTRRHGVFLIADEILTGFWRTGEMLAIRHAGVIPDFLCLSKGLTAGWLPFSAVLIAPETHSLFYADYGLGRDFLHSNTYSGNALGAAVALEALRIYCEPGFGESVTALAEKMAGLWRQVASAAGLASPRGLGAMAAGDLPAPPGMRAGFAVFQEAVARGAMLRNLGNTLYWLPPLNIPHAALDRLAEITADAVAAARRKSGF